MINSSGDQIKPTVVVLGTVGHGKSLFLNRLAGENVFESKKQVQTVTTEPKMVETDEFKIIDTPGLNDRRIDTKDWVERFNNSENATGPQPLALAILIFKATDRPQNGDYIVLQMCMKAVGDLKPDNLALVFTHCDMDGEFDKDYAFDWYQNGIVHDGLGMP